MPPIFFSKTFVDRVWYSKNTLSLLLLPISWIYIIIIKIRSALYRVGIIPISKINVPIIVVGNITAGGTGKTPLVIWLANYFKNKGFLPGIISRGYGGKYLSNIEFVHPNSDPLLVGDEPLIIAKKCNCPVAVAKKRVRAAKELVSKYNCNIIISDDGMQHYSLGRDIEIAVIDGQRRLGNGYCLPAGPLREPKNKLLNIDLIVSKYTSQISEYTMEYIYQDLISLGKPAKTISLSELCDMKVHVITGIDNPENFFSYLQTHKLELIIHQFPDHHIYEEHEVVFNDDLPIIMTEKDAVKCARYSNNNHWYIPIVAKLPNSFNNVLDTYTEKMFSG